MDESTARPARSPSWPRGARAVMNVTIHMDGPAVEAGRGLPPYAIHSKGRYSARRGVPRMLDILARNGAPATFFMCGHDAELYPDLMREVARAGHEIAAHGYMHEGDDPGDAEPELLTRTHHILTDVTGMAPIGWCSPSGRKSKRTLPVLRALGYVYDTSEKDDDLPYLLDAGFAILPNNTSSLDDFPFYATGQATAAEVLANMLTEIDVLAAAGGYIHLIFHPRAGGGSGSLARASVLDAVLTHARAIDGLEITTCAALARHLLAAEGAP